MSMMTTLKRGLLLSAVPVLFATAVPVTAHAQYDRNGNYYNGARNGYGHGGYDNDHRYDQRDQYRNDHYRDNRGGIGPGKGALIGGAGGAALGGLLGGGLKGALIGGGAGAGIGAIAGKAHQNNVRQRDGYYPR